VKVGAQDLWLQLTVLKNDLILLLADGAVLRPFRRNLLPPYTGYNKYVEPMSLDVEETRSGAVGDPLGTGP
jgi:hypothetical protein